MNKTRIFAVVALLFGLATVIQGGRTLFLGGPERVAGGTIVPFVLMFNFIAGFFYLTAGAGILAGRRWAAGLAAGIALTTAFVFAMLGVHISFGRAYEVKTVIAMTVRTAFWSLAAWALLRKAGPGAEPENLRA